MEKYRKLRVLGRGATAHVWLAEGPTGLVALKVAHQPGALKREIALLQRVRHPYIARLHDADPHGDWIAAEHARGGESLEWAESQRVPAIVDFVARVGEAIDALHSVGVMHGDLKPGNVLVGERDAPLLVDLGSGSEGQSPGGGTPGFVSPERLRGQAPTPLSDLWGLGALAYTLLTQTPPYSADDPAALAWAPLVDLPEPPSSLRHGIAGGVEDVILQWLAHRPEARGHTMRGGCAELRLALSSPMRAAMVGMKKERRLLRRAVVDLLGGGRAMVLLYGSAGVGRRALIRETVNTARREGMHVVSGVDRAAVLVALSRGPCVLAVDGSAPGVEALLGELLATSASVLTLVRLERPLPGLARRGARHMHPPKLTREDLQFVAQGQGYDSARAEELWTRTQGLPGAVFGLLNPGAAPALTPVAQGVLKQLRSGALTVPALARRLEMSEHQLLDLAEPMIDRGLIVASADGMWLSVARF